MNINIESSWNQLLKNEFEQPYFKKLIEFLSKEYTSDHSIFPLESQIFRAFEACPIDKVKVVILGQDPYHSFEIIENEVIPHAHGLCFSIPRNTTKIPPSLKNINKELESDLGITLPVDGDLNRWADQGVLMLNSVLTVREGQADSHAGKGWELFTDAVIQKLSETRKDVVYLLWGSKAQRKAENVDKTQNCILLSPHPSPLSAYRGFFGCKHFSKSNVYLKSKGQTPINW